MRYIEGYTSRELGELFNLSPSTLGPDYLQPEGKCLNYIIGRKRKVIDVEKRI